MKKKTQPNLFNECKTTYAFVRSLVDVDTLMEQIQHHLGLPGMDRLVQL
jgi:hypothetical protein